MVSPSGLTFKAPSKAGGGGAVGPTEPHPSWTKMSLTFVPAPVEVREEMAAPLPVPPPPSHLSPIKYPTNGL